MTGLGFITDTPRSGLPFETAPPLTAMPTPPPPLPPRRSPPRRPEFKAPPEPPDEFADLPPPVPPTAEEIAAEAAAMVALRARQKFEMDHKMTNQSDIYDLLMLQQQATRDAQARREALGLEAKERDEAKQNMEKDPPYEHNMSSSESDPGDLTPEASAAMAARRAARLAEYTRKRRAADIEEMRLIALAQERKQRKEGLEAAREAAERAAKEAAEQRRDDQSRTAAERAAAARLAAERLAADAKAAAERLAADAKAAAERAEAAAEAERRRQAQLKAQRERDLASDDDMTDDDDPDDEGSPPPISDEDRLNLARIEREEGRAHAFADMIDSISFTVEINHGLQMTTCPYCQLQIGHLAYDEKKAHLLADLAREIDEEPYPRADEMVHGPGALDLEYDDHAMRRWVYIDERTHCQHCGIEFTEVGMRKVWLTGAERRSQLPNLAAAIDLQHRNHRIRCPYQRRRADYNHLAQWGNSNPLDGRSFATLPRRSRADLNHLYAQMDAMGDDTYALELIYNQTPRNLLVDAVRTVIRYPYNTELTNSQAQEYARAQRHVFCPSCRRRLRRRPYQVDGEERPAAETLEEHRARCNRVPLPADFIGWISLEMNQYLGKLRSAYPAKATLIAVSEQVKWFHRWRLAANSTVPFTIHGIGCPDLRAGWPPVPLPPCFVANAAVVLAATPPLPIPRAIPHRPYRAHDGTTKDDQGPQGDDPEDDPDDDPDDLPEDVPAEKEKEAEEDRSSSPEPASDDSDPEDEDDNPDDDDVPQDDDADDADDAEEDEEEEEDDDQLSEFSEDEDDDDELLLKRSDILKGTARASRARRAGIVAQQAALQATRAANQANLNNLGAEAVERAAKRAALDVVEGSTGLNAAQMQQAANLAASNARGAAAVAAITATIAANDAALLVFATQIAAAEAEYRGILAAVAAAVAAEKEGKTSKEDAMTDAEKAARVARRAARLERAQRRAARLADRTAKETARAAANAAKEKAKADAKAKDRKASTKARQENRAKSRARKRARRALKLDAQAKAAKAIADEIARKAAERAAVPNPDPCPIIEFLCGRLAHPINPGGGARFSSGMRKVTSRVVLDAPPGAWVSFMFPTYDNTDYAPAPMITPVTLAAFAGGNQPYQKYNMGVNYFMRHLGFSVPQGAITHIHTNPAKAFIAKGVAARAPGFMSWLNPTNINHNHITRMLTSLSILGRQAQAITLNAALVAAIGARAGPLAPAPAVLAAWAAAANLTPAAIAAMEAASIPLRLAQIAPPLPPPPPPPPAPPAPAMRKHGIIVYEGASYYAAKRRRLHTDMNPLLHFAIAPVPSGTLEADNIRLKAFVTRSKMKRYVSPHGVGRPGKRRKWHSGESVEPANLLVTKPQGAVEEEEDSDDHDGDQSQDKSGAEDDESQSSQDLEQEETDVDDSSVEGVEDEGEGEGGEGGEKDEDGDEDEDEEDEDEDEEDEDEDEEDEDEDEEDEESGDEGDDEEGEAGEDDSEDGSGEVGTVQEKPGEASESDENSEDEPERDELSAASDEGDKDTKKKERGKCGSPERLRLTTYRNTANYSPRKPRASTSEEKSGMSVQSDADDSSDGDTASSSDIFLSVYQNPASVLLHTAPRVSGKSPSKPMLPLVSTDQNAPTYTPQSRLLRTSDPAFHLQYQT